MKPTLAPVVFVLYLFLSFSILFLFITILFNPTSSYLWLNKNTFLSSQGTEVNKNSISYISFLPPKKGWRGGGEEEERKYRKGLGPDYIKPYQLCLVSVLAYTIVLANSADDKFSKKIGFDISCKLSPLEAICMKCQSLFPGKQFSRNARVIFSGKNKKYFKMPSVDFLPSMQIVKHISGLRL